MKLTILIFVVLLTETALTFGTKEAKPYLLTGIKQRRNAAELKAYHQQRRLEAAAAHKLYFPAYPDEPPIANIRIGKSEQSFNVSIETSINNIFVLDVSYTTHANDVATFNPHDPSSSATPAGWYNSFSDKFGADGGAYLDTVTFLHPMDLRLGVINQTFDSQGRFTSYYFTVSGVLGLAWDPDEKDKPVTQYFDPIINLFAKMPNLPRYFVQAVGQKKNDDRFGWWSIMFGGELTDHCAGNILTSATVFFNNYRIFSFNLDVFGFGTATAEGYSTNVDMGLPVLFLSVDALSLVHDAIQPDYDYDLDLYTTPCNNAGKFDDLVFTVGGVDLRVSSKHYILDLGLGTGQCVLAINTYNKFTAVYVLGLPFLNNYCVKFSIDNTSISFQNVR
ncbi:Aspartic peptidase family and Aspartic peptidase domain-containing protein [Aphelenchoides besseyi]|nr:Aspartic peptidase family and Aspartic peptidase domain-containing protein [Aphelenchoides besseyi]